jgi:hypothetical protein
MANLVELSKMAENMPDQQLVQAAQGQGSLPAYVAITEVKRRADLRKAYNAQVAQTEMPQATVAEQVISEYVQPGLQGMAQQGMAPERQGFQEGGSTAFTPKSYGDFLVETDQKGYFGLGNLKEPDMDAIDKYLLSAGLDPQILAGLSKMQKIQYISKIEDYQKRSLPEGFNTADPISKAAVNIDQSPEVVPGSETKERDEPMVDQPPVSSLSDFTQIYDAIAAPLDVKSTPINTPQALKDYQQRIQDKKDAPIEGLQAIDIPIKSAEEKQNEREVSALGDLAIAISGAKNLGELGVGLGRASKGVQAIKDKQEEQILDARLKQRELQRQDIEFTRAQELGTLAGIELEMDKAQRDADDKAETRAFERKKATLDALSNTVKLEIYERSILATNDANARKQETALVNYYKAKQAELELADADRRKVIQEELKELDKIIQAALVNKPIDASALGNTGANEVGMTEFFSE